jgi:multidrug efflux pump subunit AcrB
VASLLIAILGVTAILTMPVDIFPYIDIPVVSIVWSYGGLLPEEMEKRIVTIFERSMTTSVNDIEHIESQSYTGASVVRVYFQPNAKVEVALSQVTAIAQTMLRILPPGTTPPNIIKYDASAVPVLQLGLQSDTLAEQELFDLGTNFIRTQLATIQGAAVPLPYGGKSAMVMVDLNPDAMFAKQLSPADISSVLGNQNMILPAGTAKIGDRDYQISLNSSPRILDEMNNMPMRW